MWKAGCLRWGFFQRRKTIEESATERSAERSESVYSTPGLLTHGSYPFLVKSTMSSVLFMSGAQSLKSLQPLGMNALSTHFLPEDPQKRTPQIWSTDSRLGVLPLFLIFCSLLLGLLVAAIEGWPAEIGSSGGTGMGGTSDSFVYDIHMFFLPYFWAVLGWWKTMEEFLELSPKFFDWRFCDAVHFGGKGFRSMVSHGGFKRMKQAVREVEWLQAFKRKLTLEDM